MRVPIFLAAVVALLAGVAAAQRRADPFVPVGVTYTIGATIGQDRTAADFQSIRALGFNSIRAIVVWRDAEPVRGDYRLDPLARVLDLAGNAGLRVVLEIDTASAPAWACSDAAGGRAASLAFVNAVTTKAAPYPSWYAVDVASHPTSTTCAGAPDADEDALVDATAPRGSRTVSRHVSVPPSVRASLDLARAFDGFQSASGPRGWVFADDTRGDRAALPTADALRLWGWLAISRGARGVMFAEWALLRGTDGTPDDRARAAGTFAGIIARNPALFAPLRPRLTSASGPAVRIDGGDGLVEARFLESADVFALIALNHSDTAQRVVLRFSPETQEAIWQNMETGSAVNFVAGAEGPTYTHVFQPQETMVLIIRRDLR